MIPAKGSADPGARYIQPVAKPNECTLILRLWDPDSRKVVGGGTYCVGNTLKSIPCKQIIEFMSN